MAFDSIPGIIDAIRFRLVADEDTIGRGVHLALVKDALCADAPVLVRVHIENALCAGPQSQCYWLLHRALRRIAKENCGVAVLLSIPAPPGKLL
jgi:3,4-dihydroxy 2-butanone 4-phosphate synthase/GTP cyclohydrolase II